MPWIKSVVHVHNTENLLDVRLIFVALNAPQTKPLCYTNMQMVSMFLCILSACCLPSSFCSRGYIVWKIIIFEEFQDDCLVLGHLWYVNGMILAISESPCCWKPSIKFLLKRIYGLEDVGWRIPRWLFRTRPSLIFEWDYFSYSEFLCCLTHPIIFFLKRIYGLEEMLFKEQKDGRWVLGHLSFLNGMILFILSLHVAWCLLHQVSAQMNIWVGITCLKNSKKAVQCMTIFGI